MKTQTATEASAGVHCDAWLGRSFNEQCHIALSAKPGDIWQSKETGRTVTVIGNSRGTLRLKHETGRVTQKQHHYFAYDYIPNAGDELRRDETKQT